MQRVAERVNRLVKVELSQHQFDAIVSLAFNIGCAAFEDSSTLKLINDPKAKTPYGDLESAWKAWNKYSSRNAEVRASVRDEPLFGIYVITDYTRYRGGLTPETSARGQVDTEAIISRDLYAVLKARIPNPRYAIRYYEDLPEGEVPCGQRRLLSNFWGFGTERDGVTVLDVYQASQGELPYLYLEVIDNDTLWVGYDGWLFQLRRKGAKGPTVPLKQRYPSDGDDPDTSGLEAPEPTPGMISRAKSKHWRIRGHKAEALAGATLSGLAWAITGDPSDYTFIKFGRAPETLRKGETVEILPLLRKAGGISDADVGTGCRLVKSRID